MKRVAIAAVVAIGAAAAAPGALHAQQKFPAKPIRLVVAFTAGDTTDMLARMVAPGMSETFGQPVVIENRPRAGGILAATIVTREGMDRRRGSRRREPRAPCASS